MATRSSVPSGPTHTTLLTPRDLSGCEHRLALDSRFPATVAVPDDAGVAMRKEAAADHRSRVRDMLHALHSDELAGWADASAGGRAYRVQQTMAAISAGARWIWGATLPDDVEGGRRGWAELLIRVDDTRGAEAHEGAAYVPVIVVNHKASDPGSGAITSPVWAWQPMIDETRKVRGNSRDTTRLAQLYRMLQSLGVAGVGLLPAGPAGGVIGLDIDCMVVLDLTDALIRYDALLVRRQGIASGEVPTAPSRIGECRSCAWWTKCGPELEAARDVSLVVNGNLTQLLATVDVRTIDELAGYEGPAPEGWPGKLDDAILMARARLADVSLIRRMPEVDVVRADVEVDVDMESYQDDGAYLWGTLLTDNTDPSRPVIYRPFVTWTPLPTRDEARSFAEFWTWLIGERDRSLAEGKTFAAYCYSQQAENRWLLGSADRFVGEPGVPTRDEVLAFINSPQWVDIYEAVNRNFLSPQGKGLKKVAPHAGFHWRDDEAGGEASMQWYRRAVGLDGDQIDHTQRARLLEYNEDDVQATKALREWMSAGAAEQVPLGTDLPGPTVRP
ncbi:TM0106 family RecB-like putative nuclease [Gordonia rubripertincta]|uniref:TM0106 family RecB-like putative nuclease n=1 Tax=Gordonia rubripertincta TaxID=36822 RepID=A0ABT4MR32_GORRU|nr:TM0106 family RecB-like putative nuclease [Gordonia rubripertincta]MCZ4549448.1 TM0106 family RecB-like putative nuclease [Gordonia rubripertincta]